MVENYEQDNSLLHLYDKIIESVKEPEKKESLTGELDEESCLEEHLERLHIRFNFNVLDQDEPRKLLMADKIGVTKMPRLGIASPLINKK